MARVLWPNAERPRAQTRVAGGCGFDCGVRLSRCFWDARCSSDSPELVASVSRTVGAVEMRDGDAASWQNIASTTALHVGETHSHRPRWATDAGAA